MNPIKNPTLLTSRALNKMDRMIGNLETLGPNLYGPEYYAIWDSLYDKFKKLQKREERELRRKK